MIGPRVRVLGVGVDCVDMAGAIAAIERLAESPGEHMVATVNPEFVMRARADAEFASVLESADLCLPDGVGVVWAARRQGARVERVAGADLVPEVARLCARRGWPLFLLGAGPGVAEQAACRLVDANPGLEIAGTEAGSRDPEHDDAAVQLIRSTAPKVLLVAYGAPFQELWIRRNRARLGVPVSIGVGGALDFVSGRVPRAPAWMRRTGLEWLFRLARQPWRIRRMAVLPFFAAAVLRAGSPAPER